MIRFCVETVLYITISKQGLGFLSLQLNDGLCINMAIGSDGTGVCHDVPPTPALHMLRSLWCVAQMGHFLRPQSPFIWVHFWRNVVRIESNILSLSLQLEFKQRISSNCGNQRYLTGVTDTGCIYGVMWSPPGDYCNGWLNMGGNKILDGFPWGINY